MQYLYQEDSQNADLRSSYSTSISSSTQLANQIATMPAEWIAQLHNAACQGNDELIFQLMAKIPKEQTDLIDGLKVLVENFDFEQVMILTR